MFCFVQLWINSSHNKRAKGVLWLSSIIGGRREATLVMPSCWSIVLFEGLFMNEGSRRHSIHTSLQMRWCFSWMVGKTIQNWDRSIQKWDSEKCRAARSRHCTSEGWDNDLFPRSTFNRCQKCLDSEVLGLLGTNLRGVTRNFCFVSFYLTLYLRRVAASTSSTRSVTDATRKEILWYLSIHEVPT